MQKRQVRTVKVSEKLMSTYSLESTEGRTSQESKRNLQSEGHSLSKEHREKQFRIAKESN